MTIARKNLSGYTIGFYQALGEEGCQAMLHLVERTAMNEGGILGGRGAIAYGALPGAGDVVVKHYTRGGLMRWFVERLYFRWGLTRPEVEGNLLERVRALGIQAPEPIAWVTQGQLVYRGWLVTREITNKRTLAEISMQDPELARDLMGQVTEQVSRLIANRIYHLDLHPGNVIIDDAQRVFLLDFDKAREFDGDLKKLRSHYLCRWRRAVIKHGLPEILSELMCGELLKHPAALEQVRAL